MLIAQMDAAATPLSTMSGDVSRARAGARRGARPPTRAPTSRAALRFAADALRGLSHAEIVVVCDGALGEPRDAAGRSSSSDVALRYVPVGKSGKNVAITEFSVRRYPLDKSRYEVMLEVTNTSDEPADVELSALRRRQLIDVTSAHARPERAPAALLPEPRRRAAAALEARIKLADGQRDDLPADDHAYALLPERRRARVLVVTRGQHVPRGGAACSTSTST